MISIPVSTSTKYDVIIGSGLLDQAGAYLRSVTKANAVAIISDSNVWPLYGHTLAESLNHAGFDHRGTYVMPAGEESKNGQTYLSILEFLAEHALDRSGCIIALGGGVVGDMTGFVAATYLRGIDFIQIPTTLLAMVDSSVGGKTAIDLNAGKNLAGAFYQPKVVLCDTDVLTSLPEAIFQDGCAEVIKYGVLYDEAFFSTLESTGISFQRDYVVARCVALKRDVVAADEFDRGQRMLLNLGHTIGHGIEGASGFAVSHGRAVAIGMAVIARSCAAKGFCSAETANRITAILQQFGLPTSTDLDIEMIYKSALSDKKRSNDHFKLIIPREIGRCEALSVPVGELTDWISVGISL